jgi:hypothetical protein
MNKLIFHVSTTRLNTVPENYNPGMQHARPLKVWRQAGCTGLTPGTPCKGDLFYGKQEKMLKVLPACNASEGPMGALQHVKGSVMSFSGNARLISGATNLPGDKYSATFAEYLRKKGRTFKANSDLHKIAGVEYYKNGYAVQPDEPQVFEECAYTSASFYGNDVATTPDDAQRPVAIYKPNNPNYSVQGAVDSGTRVQRLKYDVMQNAQTHNKKFPNPACKKKGCARQTA